MLTFALDPNALAAYESDILAWRQRLEASLRSDEGWLTLTGLYWLHAGQNSLGSDETCDVVLPESAPKSVGALDFRDGTVTLSIMTNVDVLVDGTAVKVSRLRDDNDAAGASLVDVGSVRFFVIRRGDEYGIRVRDRNHPARQTFAGRRWLPIDLRCRVVATFVPRAEPRTLEVVSSVGMPTPMENPGAVEFELMGHHVRLEAFSTGRDELWLIFKDANPQIYPGGRFLYAPLSPEGEVLVDFNKAYSPPCAFTHFATCPLPPPENRLPFPVEAGEIVPAE